MNLGLEKSIGPYLVERRPVADKGVKRPTTNPFKGTDQKIKLVHRKTVVVSLPPPPTSPPLPRPGEILQPIPAPLTLRAVVPPTPETVPKALELTKGRYRNDRCVVNVPTSDVSLALTPKQSRPEQVEATPESTPFGSLSTTDCRKKAVAIRSPRLESNSDLIVVSMSSTLAPVFPPFLNPNQILQPIPAPPILFEPLALPLEIIPKNYLDFVVRAENLAHFIGHSLAFLRSSQKELYKFCPSVEPLGYTPKPVFVTVFANPRRGSRCDDYLIDPHLVKRYVPRPEPPTYQNNYYKMVANREPIESSVENEANRPIVSRIEIRVNRETIENTIKDEANHQNCDSDNICGNDDNLNNELPVNSGQRFSVGSEPRDMEPIPRAPPPTRRSTRKPHTRFKGFIFLVFSHFSKLFN